MRLSDSQLQVIVEQNGGFGRWASDKAGPDLAGTTGDREDSSRRWIPALRDHYAEIEAKFAGGANQVSRTGGAQWGGPERGPEGRDSGILEEAMKLAPVILEGAARALAERIRPVPAGIAGPATAGFAVAPLAGCAVLRRLSGGPDHPRANPGNPGARWFTPVFIP
ncbi:MAG: hypothetical protein IPM24_25230 [Bryobacterales bacterium]|nr:hypothetical protein [Bryobacterales bacterium]